MFIVPLGKLIFIFLLKNLKCIWSTSICYLSVLCLVFRLLIFFVYPQKLIIMLIFNKTKL